MGRRLKVLYIYREKSPYAYSLERVFRTISNHIYDATVIEYVMRGRKYLLADIFHIRRLNADIYHVTGDVNYIVPFLPRGKSVLTIHDIGHYLFSLKGIKRKIYKWVWLSLPIYFASVIHYPSDETKRCLTKIFNIPEAKLKFIENCVTTNVRQVEKYFNAKCPTVLQIGTRGYKNVPRLIQALHGITCKLVLVGVLEEEIKNALQETNVVYENHVGISDNELIVLYQSCDIVSFISIGEGFGLPILEAQASGKPLITSNIEPLCSVAGQGSYLVNPLDINDIRKGFQNLIDDDCLRQQVVVAGLLNVKAYSPKAIADKFLALYNEILDNVHK